MADKTKQYRPFLLKFMTHRDKTDYLKEKEFTQEELLLICPSHLVRFFSKMAYGVEEPAAGDFPTKCRHTTLLNYKKAISFFMPRRSPSWDDIDKRGNPTKSDAVNELIKAIKKHKVWRTGSKLQARQPLEYNEFLQLMEAAGEVVSDKNKATRFRAMLATQWQLIRQVDNTQKIQAENLLVLMELKNFITCQMQWSKNILEERDSPLQLLVGSMDERLCVMIHLAAHLETHFEKETGGGQGSFVFGNGVDGDRFARSILGKIMASDKFENNTLGPIGTHSIRKGAATFAGRNGVIKDHINLRGGGRQIRGLWTDTLR